MCEWCGKGAESPQCRVSTDGAAAAPAARSAGGRDAALAAVPQPLSLLPLSSLLHITALLQVAGSGRRLQESSEHRTQSDMGAVRQGVPENSRGLARSRDVQAAALQRQRLGGVRGAASTTADRPTAAAPRRSLALHPFLLAAIERLCLRADAAAREKGASNSNGGKGGAKAAEATSGGDHVSVALPTTALVRQPLPAAPEPAGQVLCAAPWRMLKISERPLVIVIDEFICAADCSALIALAAPLLGPAKVGRGLGVIAESRTCQLAWITGVAATHPAVARLERRVLQATEVSWWCLCAWPACHPLLLLRRLQPQQRLRPALASACCRSWPARCRGAALWFSESRRRCCDTTRASSMECTLTLFLNRMASGQPRCMCT